MQKNWKVYFFKLFHDRLKDLKRDVESLKQKDPNGYVHHYKTKLLAKIYKVIFDDIKLDPANKKFLLGNTLGKQFRMWRRARNELPPRYRLFFRFNSNEVKIIIVWINDDSTLRKDGSVTDVYRTFTRMISSKQIPSDWLPLLQKSKRSS